MMDVAIIITIIVAVALGGALGWLFAARQSGALTAERDALRRDRDEQLERFKAAARDLEQADREREASAVSLAALRAEREADARAHAAQVEALIAARDSLSAQFQDVGAKLLERAQEQFLHTANARFRESEAAAGHSLQQLLQPVNERLQRYETAVEKIE
ncbi:MAG: DNA recombination protein RmuC, partial [Sphingopyxis sp.]|nr:DNA recombination protein RmuC [Sphingopyxis sp.]